MNNPTVDKLLRDVLQAQKDGDIIKKQTLQSVLTRITNAQAVDAGGVNDTAGVGSTEVARRELSPAEVRKIICQEADELDHAISSMASYPNHPYAAELKAKAAILADYL